MVLFHFTFSKENHIWINFNTEIKLKATLQSPEKHFF